MESVKLEKIQLDVSGDEALEFIEFIDSKKKKLMAEYPDVFNKLREYDSQINKLMSAALKAGAFPPTGAPTIVIQESFGYPKNGSWNQKIQFFLQNGKQHTAREIKDLVIKYDEVAPWDDKDMKRVGIGIAASLSTGATKERIIYKRVENEKGDYLYSLK